MQPTRNILILITLLLFITGCGPQLGGMKPTGPPKPNPLMEQALSLETSGDYLAAAGMFQQLAAKAKPPGRYSLLMRAAENLHKAGESDAALTLLSQIDSRALPNIDFRKRLLAAELALSRNRPDEALRLLQTPPGADAGKTLQQRYHKDLAEAYRLSGNLLESAHELAELDLLIDEAENRLENQLNILQTLATLTDTALELLQPSPPGIRGGWMELARIIKGHAVGSDQSQPLIDNWRETFPNHPAMPELLKGHFTKLKAQYRRPSHLAVLLPSRGPYAKSAVALRDGFMAAYYQQPVTVRPRLVFYDSSNSADTWPLYRQAVDSGADMVIGPLNKESVSQLARAGELEIPVLALNQVPPEVTQPADLYQFGLAPEDEARQVAERAWLDGYTRATALTPMGDWGERIYDAFRDRWERLGGTLIEHQSYNAKDNDFSRPIRAMLNIDESYARRRHLQQLLGKKVEFEPRRREDTDFIFLAAKRAKARQIRPQLQFHHASGIPVYTTSHIYSGTPSAKEDQDLNGLFFPDIPWVLVAGGDEPLSRERLMESQPEGQQRYHRLYAMGIDSFHLLPHLARLETTPQETLDANTGNLYLDELNRVHRQLVWAEIHRGVPRVIGYAPRIDLEIGGQPLLDTESVPTPTSEEIQVTPVEQDPKGNTGEHPNRS
ncbi:MAG: penicillin-binding protein activator [Candidatus Sedimenticola sp. (ex Thyasira tokunagai)]